MTHLLTALLLLVAVSSTAQAASVNSRCGSGMFLRRVNVASVPELNSALAAAIPGDFISIKAGTYKGSFSLVNKSGSSRYKIFVCGDAGVVFEAAKSNSGYGIYLKGSNFIKVANIEVTGYQKGVVLDASSDNLLLSLKVHDIATEGVHFRTHSQRNMLKNSEISYTGLVEDWFGEGVYIGSAKSNWCTYTGCKPDLSNDNQVIGNYVHHTGAESVDIKEGTTGGLIKGNVFEGSRMTGEYADSFIDVKGNNYSIETNIGQVGFSSTGRALQVDGFQVHVVVAGFGESNAFTGNTIYGVLPGYIVNVQSTVQSWNIGCDNSAVNGAKGISNKKCE